MVQPRVDRKLVSVVVADVVGYSHLTELDEEGTAIASARIKTSIDSISQASGGMNG